MATSRAADLWARLGGEAEACHRWSAGPGTAFPEHAHAHTKVLYCTGGSIAFRVGAGEVRLAPGDRLELPAGTPHSAVAGERGCTCVEGRGRKMAAR